MLPNYCRTEPACKSAGAKAKSSHDPFRMLRFLNVNGTLLATWDDIDKIARFPALKSLRIQGCPLFEVRIRAGAAPLPRKSGFSRALASRRERKSTFYLL